MMASSVLISVFLFSMLLMQVVGFQESVGRNKLIFGTSLLQKHRDISQSYIQADYSYRDSTPVDSPENCSNIYDVEYNRSICESVREDCENKYELFNYLEFIMCGLGEPLVPLGYIMLILWGIYLLSLLSTTVDVFFVPVLQMMSEMLHLPPSIAGMTLLALGNGAPDIFVAFSALIKDDDLTLLLGALLGAGIFITTVVLGTVLMVAKSRVYGIDKIDFLRDVIAYMIVLVVIIAVSVDGKVYLVEVALFPVTYIGYVIVVLLITVLRKWVIRYKARKQMHPEKIAFNKTQSEVVIDERHLGSDSEEEKEEDSVKDGSDMLTSDESAHSSDDEKSELTKDDVEVHSSENENSARENNLRALSQCKNKCKNIKLPGLTMPEGGILRKLQFFLEWPVSLLRWLTIPPCCHDGTWTLFHYLFASFSPVPMSLLLMVVASEHWSVFEMKVGESEFPLPILVVICVFPVCIPLLLLLNWKSPPGTLMKVLLMIMSFGMSICWLYLIADEVVSVLQALGLLASISTAILGLTVLAIGNSVADWVADSVISLKGRTQMAIASCFGAPLITHVLGISFAFLARMIADGGHVYSFNVHSEEFVHVKMAWIFLAIVLFGNALVFSAFRFSPPREFGVILIYVYIVFMVFSVLIETQIITVFD